MTVIIGTVCKNISPNIPIFRIFLQILLGLFPDAKVCIYENNSTDDTKEGLHTLKSLGSNIHIQMEDYTNEILLGRCRANTWDMKPCRMEMIAMARNKLLEMIERVGYSDSDLIVMIDSDISVLPAMDVLVNRLQNFPKDIDVLFANGVYSGSSNYYDRYALRYAGRPFGPETVGDEFWKTLPDIRIEQPTSIISGFGGLAIYKGYCIRDNQYSALPTKNLDRLIKDIISMGGSRPQVPADPCRDGCLLGMYLFGNGPDDLFYYNNSGYNYPVVCEHSTFNVNILLRGQGRFIIDPQLMYYV